MTLVADPGVEERLRAVPGVADAEVGPGSDRIRIRMLPGADPRRVMEAVRAIFGEQGLRVRTAPPRSKVEPVEPPPPPATPRISAPPSEAPAPDREAALSSVAVDEERDRIRVSVRSSDGRRAERTARSGRRGLEEALLQAVAALVLPDGPVPGLRSAEERMVGDQTVVTVVLEGPSGEGLAGSAVVRSGWPFAFARAVWAALTF